MNEVDSLLERARRELTITQSLIDQGFDNVAISRAYYAAFYAATAALLELGYARSKHSGVISAFGQLLVRGEGLGSAAGRDLRRLFEERSAADYGAERASATMAEESLRRATAVVEEVDRWFTSRT